MTQHILKVFEARLLGLHRSLSKLFAEVTEDGRSTTVHTRLRTRTGGSGTTKDTHRVPDNLSGGTRCCAMRCPKYIYLLTAEPAGLCGLSLPPAAGAGCCCGAAAPVPDGALLAAAALADSGFRNSRCSSALETITFSRKGPA